MCQCLFAAREPHLACASQVNEAVNELLIEEEDFSALRDSITTYDNFDQLALAGRCATSSSFEHMGSQRRARVATPAPHASFTQRQVAGHVRGRLPCRHSSPFADWRGMS